MRLQRIRTNTAKGFINLSHMLRCRWEEVETQPMTVPAAGAALPQFASTVQQFTEVTPEAETIVCSGTVIATNDVVGILAFDAKAAATSVTYITKARAILVPLTASLTIAVGEDIYWDASAGTFTNVASTHKWVGKARKVKETNPDGLPAGDWCEIEFKQSEV